MDPSSLSLNSLQYQQSGSPIIEPFYCVAIASTELCELVRCGASAAPTPVDPFLMISGIHIFSERYDHLVSPENGSK